MHSLDILLPIGRRLVPAAGCQRASVRGDRLADHPLAEIARQEQHDACDVVALPVAADGDPRRHEMLVLGGEGVVVHRSEEHTSELQYLMRISYAVFRLNKKPKYYTYTIQ